MKSAVREPDRAALVFTLVSVEFSCFEGGCYCFLGLVFNLNSLSEKYCFVVPMIKVLF
jgi:hypothetical protein